MDVLGQFRENLNLVLQLAATEGDRVTREQVQGCFGDLELNEDQWELIYHYLEMNKVQVADHETDVAVARQLTATEEASEKEEGTPEERESAFFAMYLEELSAILPLDPAEEPLLLEKMQAGDSAARERLIEGKLSLAAAVAKRYAGRGMGENDLVQEANVALMLALATYEEGPLDAYLEEEIGRSLELVLLEESGMDNVGVYLMNQANALLKASTELAEELGREATVEELAKRTGQEESLIEELMKMSLDAVNVVENGNLS